MARITLIAVVLASLALAGVASAFEEQKAPPKAAAGQKAAPADAASLADSDVAVIRPGVGTKIRVPGLGVIGEIPKMDFGLELLYGASQPKQPNEEQQGNGVMGRVTLPIKPSR